MSRAITSISAAARAIVTPGFSRATPRRKNGPRLVGGIERENGPGFDVPLPEFEAGRHDTDDHVRPPVQRDGASQHIQPRPVAPAPEAIAQHDASRARLTELRRQIFAGEKRAADGRIHAKRLKERRHHPVSDHLFGLPVTGQREPAVREAIDLEDVERLERPRLRFPVEEIGQARAAAAGVVRHDDQTIRIRERQRPQEHAIDDAEDGRVDADAQRERQHRHECESRRAKERPQPIPRVARDRLQANSPVWSLPPVDHGEMTPVPRQISEPSLRFAPRGLFRPTVPHQRLDGFRKVKFELVVDRRVRVRMVVAIVHGQAFCRASKTFETASENCRHRRSPARSC